MQIWNPKIELTISPQQPVIEINLEDRFVLSSKEIKKLLRIFKQCQQNQTKLVLFMRQKELQKFLAELGFSDLGIELKIIE